MPTASVPSTPFKALFLEEVPEGYPDDDYLSGIRAAWDGQRTGDRLPARTDFPFETLLPWLGHVSLVDVEHAPRRFRWRLIGTAIAEKMGRDSTGARFEDLYEQGILEGYIEAYSKAVDRREPVYFRGDLEFVGKEFRHFRMVQLPLATDGDVVDMLMLCLRFDDE